MRGNACVMIAKRCEGCGKNYAASCNATKFCSRACWIAHKRTVETTCPRCGKVFEQGRWRAAAGRRFCSRSCAYESMRTRLDRTCERCGSAFAASASVVAAGRGRFCSRACRCASQVVSHVYDCANCGAAFDALPRVRAEGNAKYCSRRCAVKGRPPKAFLWRLGGELLNIKELAAVAGMPAGGIAYRLRTAGISPGQEVPPVFLRPSKTQAAE